jgi:archaetidylinositol phosphate synthase
MLNKWRRKIEPLTATLGKRFSGLGLSPTAWSTIGFVFAIASATSFGLSNNSTALPLVLIGSILLIVSGFFDIVDGSVARYANQSTKKGAFIDSVYDKFAEIFLFIGISVGGLANPILCLVAASMSLMVSYSRARAESLGIELKGIGIGERAERLLVIAVAGFIPNPNSIEIATLIVAVLSAITLLQRILHIVRKLRLA